MQSNKTTKEFTVEAQEKLNKYGADPINVKSL